MTDAPGNLTLPEQRRGSVLLRSLRFVALVLAASFFF
ncbi:Hypothetical Protein RradSPS_2949 (plasmid) [Rubrobacter radiotolerans]|uniref:Uncharacterized protein n=1 Tax=Rubrobacter radiotolerans TaxID=42256 RepID=A0A023X710_RUBRA|nr:Hypothetical Protein RradSPS_2949 [Rubrobacter radiotolerans]